MVRKSIENDVGNRCGIGTDFSMISDRFGLSFQDPKSIKVKKLNIEIRLEVVDEKDAAVSGTAGNRGATQGGSAERSVVPLRER